MNDKIRRKRDAEFRRAMEEVGTNPDFLAPAPRIAKGDFLRVTSAIDLALEEMGTFRAIDYEGTTTDGNGVMVIRCALVRVFRSRRDGRKRWRPEP